MIEWLNNQPAWLQCILVLVTYSLFSAAKDPGKRAANIAAKAVVRATQEEVMHPPVQAVAKQETLKPVNVSKEMIFVINALNVLSDAADRIDKLEDGEGK